VLAFQEAGGHQRRLSLDKGLVSSNVYIFVLPNSLELETEMKLRLGVLKKTGLLSAAKRPIAFQYIGMFAGNHTHHRIIQKQGAGPQCAGSI
jgi:hypothetical protein